MHKFFLIAIALLISAGAIITIMQIWSPLFDWMTYGKLMGTFVILILLFGLILVLKSDLAQHRKLKDENYLD